MDFICTTCCKEKRTDDGLLPAVQRYTDDRISYVAQESKRLSQPLLILSGKYGLIKAETPISWYDQALLDEDVEDMVPHVATQLTHHRAATILFYAEPSIKDGWWPYHELLEQACRQADVELRLRVLY
jgi:hypothetical protein